MIYLHANEEVLVGRGRPFGMAIDLISSPIGDNEGKSYYFPFEINPTKLEMLNSVNNPCVEGESLDGGFQTCLGEYLDGKLGCQLPWRNFNSVGWNFRTIEYTSICN